MAVGLGSLSPEDFAAILRSAPPGAATPPQRIPFGLNPSMPGQGLEGAERPTLPSFGAGSQMPDAPQMPSAPRPPAPTARTMTAAPMPPERPAGLSDSPADMPAPGAVPTSGNFPEVAAPSQAAPGKDSSFLDDLMGGIQKTDGLLGSLGIGLLSTPGMGQGLAAGLKNHQAAGVQKAATNLANAEFGLKQAKAAREARGENATKAWLTGKGLDSNLADAAMGNPAVLQNVLSQLTKDPSRVTIGGNIYELKPGDRPSAANLLGPAEPGVDTIRARAQASAEGTAAGKPEETFTLIPEAERASLGLPAGSYQRDSKGKVSAVNPTGTTINMGAEKAQDATVGKGYGEYQLDMATKGRNAGSTLNTLALMEQAMKAPGFYSGFGGETAKRANQILGSLGVKDPKAASAAEVFDALSNKVVLDGLGGSLGPGISNTDRDYIARTAPTLAQSEQGNRDLIGVARALAQRQQAVSKLARDYAAANGGRLDAGFDQALDDFATKNPLFPQARAGEAASAPKEPPQGAPQGSRQAADGNWYAPDPSRPGKYLKVQ